MEVQGRNGLQTLLVDSIIAIEENPRLIGDDTATIVISDYVQVTKIETDEEYRSVVAKWADRLAIINGLKDADEMEVAQTANEVIDQWLTSKKVSLTPKDA